MVVDEDNKFIFVHVYKNGGSSVERALGGRTFNHGNILHSKAEAIPSWEDYFSFGFVRNPWDRLVSDFFYKNRYKSKMPSFEEYVRSLKSGAKSAAQYNQVKNCSFIGRFEYFQEDLDTVCDIINIDRVSLPHLVKSTHRYYTEYYTDELKEIAYNFTSYDIEHFGFTFNGSATQNIGVRR